MKIALTTQDTIKIDIELLNDTVTHSSSSYDIVTLTAQLAQHIKEHLTLLHNARKDAENLRVQQEILANKKRRRFSNFSEDVSSTQKPSTFKDAVTLSVVQKRLEQDGLLMNSGLPEVVRFRNSPYAYTVKANEWSSPFGSSGVEANDLLKDIAKNIYKMSDLDVLGFVVKYGS